MAIDVVSAELHLGRGITDQGHAALTSVGVAGELEIKWFGRPEIVEEIRLMHQRDNRGVFPVAVPGKVWCGMPPPDRVQPIDEDVFPLYVDIGSGILEVGHSNAFNFLFNIADVAVPAVVISGAGKDAVSGGDSIESLGKFGEGRGVIDDKISGHHDEIRAFSFHRLSKFDDQFIIESRSIVDVCDLCDSKSIERFRPPGKGEILPGHRE